VPHEGHDARVVAPGARSLSADHRPDVTHHDWLARFQHEELLLGHFSGHPRFKFALRLILREYC
jgi:hypothetical protein